MKQIKIPIEKFPTAGVTVDDQAITLQQEQ